MSSNAFGAEPMLDTEEYLQAYKEQLTELGNEGRLPPLDAELEYKVYSIRGEKFGAHKSIVLTADDENFVTVELGFIRVDGKKHIYPVTRSIDKSAVANMEYHGVIEATGQDLIVEAVAVMKDFGRYSKPFNNCQDFCNMYVNAIGLKHAQQLTDGDKLVLKVTKGVIVASILLFLFGVKR